MKILIADSGATKTDWLLVDGSETTEIRTQGLHPATIEEKTDLTDLKDQLTFLEPSKVFFYGTGCGNPESDDKIERLLRELFPGAAIQVHSDLEGSARAFFGTRGGAVLIFGTGAICAKVENGNVIQKSAALGYAIGDEGSAADLGRRILKICFRGEGSKETVQYIREKLNGADYFTMMNRIYTSPKPNRELASIAGDVLKKPYPHELDGMIRTAFQDFIDHQLSMLQLAETDKIVATGRVAHIHQQTLIALLNENGYPNAAVKFPVISSFKEKILSSEINFT